MRKISMLQITSIIRLAASSSEREKESQSSLVVTMKKDAKKVKQGRPVDAVKNSAFTKVIQYLEANDEEQTTVSDLVQIISEALDGTNEEPYSTVYMTTKLQEHFGDKTVITSMYGKSNVVTFRQTAACDR